MNSEAKEEESGKSRIRISVTFFEIRLNIGENGSTSTVFLKGGSSVGKGDQLLPVAIHKGAAEDRAFGWGEVSWIQEEALVSGARAPGEGSTHLG